MKHRDKVKGRIKQEIRLRLVVLETQKARHWRGVCTESRLRGGITYPDVCGAGRSWAKLGEAQEMPGRKPPQISSKVMIVEKKRWCCERRSQASWPQERVADGRFGAEKGGHISPRSAMRFAIHTALATKGPFSLMTNRCQAARAGKSGRSYPHRARTQVRTQVQDRTLMTRMM